MSDTAPIPSAAIHVRPTAPVAERVLLPGDPGRALLLAQSLLKEPRMFNHHHGLWGYTGTASDDRSLTIQATGIGGPSSAIVLSELIALGVRRVIRIGTCGALVRSLGLGDLVIARESICCDGTSRALGASERLAANGELTEALVRAAPAAQAGTIMSMDLFYETANSRRRRATDGALAVEMEAAALFAVGAAADVPVACLLAVSDTFDASGTRTRIDDSSLATASERMGGVAVAALVG